MRISARNLLHGTVRSVTMGAVMCEIGIDVGGHEIVAAITRGSAERLGLREGADVTAIIKATDVMIGVGD